MGVEVGDRRGCGSAPQELDLARLVFVNMLDRERADFFRTLDALKEAFGPHVVATEIPIGAEHERPRRDRPRRHEGLRVRRRRPRQLQARSRSPTSLARRAEEYREKLMDEVAEDSDALMERYLEGEEISHEEIVERAQGRHQPRRHLPGHLRRGHAQPRHQPPARRDRRGPALAGQARRPASCRRAWRSSPTRTAELFAYVFKTLRRPVRRAHQPLPRLPGHDDATTRQVLNTRTHDKERIGQLLVLAGQGDRPRRRVRRRATSARWPSSRRRSAGDWLAGARRADRDAGDQAARAGDGVRDRAARPRATRTRCSRRCAACRRRTRRSTCTATRRPASRSSPGSRRSTSR